MTRGVYERTPEQREKTRQRMLGKKYALGHKCSPEAREKMRQAQRRPEVRERKRQAMLGHKHSPETIEKIRQANLGHPKSAEHREKIRQGGLGNKHLLGYRHSPEAREKQRKARLRQRFPTQMTSIERILIAEFKKRRLKFEMHKKMFGKWTVDFVFANANLIVEADGDYWHSIPGTRTRDAALDEYATAEGWAVWHFGEHQIHMHPAACARAVARFVRDHHVASVPAP